jgi:hypothetical protein
MDITLMRGRRRDEQQGKWKEITSTFGMFADVLMQHAEGEKDGPCYLQGQSAGGTRKSAAQIANYILGVDLDSGAPLGDVMETIQNAGLEAIIYTTHSHLKATSVIKRDHFMKKMGVGDGRGGPVRQYLIDYKGILPQIVEELEIIDDGQAHRGRHRHPRPAQADAEVPGGLPAVGAVRVRQARRLAAGRDPRMEGALRRLLHQARVLLRREVRRSCSPVLLPAPPGRGHELRLVHIIGNPLDLDKFERVKMSRRSRGPAGPANAFTAAGGGAGGGATTTPIATSPRTASTSGAGRRSTPSASRYRRCSKRSSAATSSASRARAASREPTSSARSRLSIRTSAAAAPTSSTLATTTTKGFEGGFTFHCVHNACAGRDRLDFLKEMIDEEMISPADLKAKEYLLELEDDEDSDPAPPSKPARANDDDATSGKASEEPVTLRGLVDALMPGEMIVELKTT